MLAKKDFNVLMYVNKKFLKIKWMIESLTDNLLLDI